MQDLELLKKRGATPEKLKALFTSTKPKDKIKKLICLHDARLRRAIETNIQEAPIYSAIDHALNAAQENLPGIQARQLASAGKTNEQIIASFKAFNLDRMLEQVVDPTTGDPMTFTVGSKKQPLMTFNQPLFDKVFVPLVGAYKGIRVAKLFNDRNLNPRYKFSPLRTSMKGQMIGDIITSRIERMTQDMGYADDEKQSIDQMASYGICFNFIKEVYHRQEYITLENDKEVTKTLREGVRFVIPHPRRHFWDRSAPLYTFNSDTGVEFAGYWDIAKYGDVKKNPLYWNTDKITYGGYDLFNSTTWGICNLLYPCVVSFPTTMDELMGMTPNDRIAKEQSMFLKDENDATVSMGVIFDKLIPSEWDLFDYDKPCWMRFIYGNLGTCLYAEVLPFQPGCVYLDHYDANKVVADSIALQLTPFQQLLGNFLTQHYISVKQNLMRIGFVNTDIVPAEQINLIRKMKDKLYQGIMLLTFSKKKDQFLAEDKREAYVPMQLAQVNTQELQTNINLTLMACERMLGFAPQEVGAAASHEQSAHEITVTAGNTGVGVEFMSTGIDAAEKAKKRILYTGFYTMGDDEVFAEVSDLTPERKKAIEELGFNVEDGHSDTDLKYGVKGKKGALTMDAFLSDRTGVNRLNDSKMGIAMLQNLGQVVANPALFQALGAKQIVNLFNYVWRMIGLPEDYQLRPQKIDTQAAPEEQQKQMMAILQQAKESIVAESVKIVGQQVKEQVVAPITQEFAALAQTLKQMQGHDAEQDAILQKIVPAVELLVKVAGQAAAQAQMPPPGMMPPGAMPPLPTQLPPQGIPMTQNEPPIMPPPPGVVPGPVGPPGGMV